MPSLKYFNRLTGKWEPLALAVHVAENESILFTAQNLTEEQKAQARQNIGASDLRVIETEDGLVLANSSGLIDTDNIETT